MSSTGSCMAIPYSTGERYSSKCPKEINEQLVVREAYKRTSYIRASVVAIWVLQVIEASLEFTPLYDTHNLNRHRFKSGLYGGHKSGATKFVFPYVVPIPKRSTKRVAMNCKICLLVIFSWQNISCWLTKNDSSSLHFLFSQTVKKLGESERNVSF